MCRYKLTTRFLREFCFVQRSEKVPEPDVNTLAEFFPAAPSTNFFAVNAIFRSRGTEI